MKKCITQRSPTPGVLLLRPLLILFTFLTTQLSELSRSKPSMRVDAHSVKTDAWATSIGCVSDKRLSGINQAFTVRVKNRRQLITRLRLVVCSYTELSYCYRSRKIVSRHATKTPCSCSVPRCGEEQHFNIELIRLFNEPNKLQGNLCLLYTSRCA